MMTTENTSGYTQQELDRLNQEFEARFNAGDFGSLYLDEAEKQFADEVARTHTLASGNPAARR